MKKDILNDIASRIANELSFGEDEIKNSPLTIAAILYLKVKKAYPKCNLKPCTSEGITFTEEIDLINGTINNDNSILDSLDASSIIRYAVVRGKNGGFYIDSSAIDELTNSI